MHPPPHLRERPKGQPARPRGRAAPPGSASAQGPHPARHGQHPAGSDGHTPLPGEEGPVPRGGQGVAAGGLRAGRAALQGLSSGSGDLQYHAGHAMVSVAGGLIVIPLLWLIGDRRGEFGHFKTK